MRILLASVILCSSLSIGLAQGFSSVLKFENASGIDSVTIGYDVKASIDLDTIFGEEDISNIQFNDSLDVRLGNVDWPLMKCGATSTKLYPDLIHYNTKVEILPRNCASDPTSGFLGPVPITTILIPNDHFPVTVTWDPDPFTDMCARASVLTDIHPGCWFDCGCYDQVFDLKFLRLDSTVLIPSKASHIIVDSFGDSLSVFFMTISEKKLTSTDDLVRSTYSVYPNPFSKELRIDTDNTFQTIFKLYRADGQQVLGSTAPVLNTEALQPGMYFLSIEEDGVQTELHKVVKVGL